MVRFCNLYSSSSGNCLFAGTGRTKILIDAGLDGTSIAGSLKEIGEDPGDITAILVSHDHRDHISGVGVLSRKYDIPIYANNGTWKQMSGCIGRIKEKNVKVFETGRDFEIGDISISSVPVPHDACEPVAFSLSSDRVRVAVATDIGHITEHILFWLEGSDLLFLESNHDIGMLMAGKYPYFLKRRISGDNGHLSNEDASKVVCMLACKGTARFILGHLSRENNYPALAYETSRSALLQAGVTPGKDISLDIAARSSTGAMVSI